MPEKEQAHSWTIPEELSGKPLDGILRGLLAVPWSKARKLIETGKVTVDGKVVTDAERRVRAGVVVGVDPRARKPRPNELSDDQIVHIDAHVVVVNKPSGISTIPYEDEADTVESRLLTRLSRTDRSSQRPSVGIVHRIDKETSGLVVFTRSWLAKQSLSQQFRFHTVHRVYLAIVHGKMESRTLRSHLVQDRGDGLRGSIEKMKRPREKRPRLEEGQLAVTHVEVRERLDGATLIACRLETGRTHQIRIHLSEAGHPLVGERVYIRDYPEAHRIPAPRLMLHAAELGFDHPKTEREVRFAADPPRDFQETLERLMHAR